jgi:hypothetical protein
MLPRQLRVGDLVDDYCPRERRLADHAIVAMVGDEVRQVRCTTCGTEHEYRGGKVPVSRKKKVVLPPPSVAGATPLPLLPAEAEEAEPGDMPAPEFAAEAAPAEPPAMAAVPEEAEGEEPGDAQPAQDGPFHRRLIRATLPRIEGDVPVRPIPEFTMHKANAPAHGNRRPFHHSGQGGQGGHGAHGRPGGGGGGGGVRHGQGHGQGQGQGHGHGYGNRASGRGGPGPSGPHGSQHGMGQKSSRGPKKH